MQRNVCCVYMHKLRIQLMNENDWYNVYLHDWVANCGTAFSSTRIPIPFVVGITSSSTLAGSLLSAVLQIPSIGIMTGETRRHWIDRHYRVWLRMASVCSANRAGRMNNNQFIHEARRPGIWAYWSSPLQNVAASYFFLCHLFFNLHILPLFLFWCSVCTR